ncbi:MAG: hypothetical protein GWP25_00280 [Euryarchaeota archaeon]|nr:hypothetical protein [Euryarchaeota archaeon]
MVVQQEEQTLEKLGNRFKAPRSGPISGLISLMSNSKIIARCRRTITSFFPFLKLRSDVKNVVYLNWMVEAEKVRHLVPKGLELWEHNGLTPFTILTYRHGSFGPSFLGPFRRLFLSPLQSNWRLYLKSPPPQVPQVSTVLFLKNSMNSHFYALGTRVFSDVLATHLPRKFIHQKKEEGFDTQILPGKGSAPELKCHTRYSNGKHMGVAFSEAFESWNTAIEFLAFQDAAISYTDRDSVFAFSEIELPIDLSTVQPLEVQSEGFRCPMLEGFSANEEPFCFVIPKVRFLATSEQLITLDEGKSSKMQ